MAPSTNLKLLRPVGNYLLLFLQYSGRLGQDFAINVADAQSFGVADFRATSHLTRYCYFQFTSMILTLLFAQHS